MNADTNVPADAAAMKAMPERNATRSRPWSIASAVAAIMVAAFTLPIFAYVNVVWNPGYYGEFGLAVDPNNVVSADANVSDIYTPITVVQVDPGSPAFRAGIRPGDKVERPQALHDRLLLLPRIAPHPGERMTIYVLRGHQRRTLTLQARPVAPLPAADSALLVLKVLWQLVFLGVGFVLVLLRPTKMTWGFYLLSLNLVVAFGPPDTFLSYIPVRWFVAFEMAEDIIGAAGLAGFLIFCLRFPANDATGWRRTIESLVPYMFIMVATEDIYANLVASRIVPYTGTAQFVISGISLALPIAAAVALLKAYVARARTRHRINWIAVGLLCVVTCTIVLLWWNQAQLFNWLAVFEILTLGIAVVLLNYFAAHGLERARIKWVVLGLLLALAAQTVDVFFGTVVVMQAYTFQNPRIVGVLELLYVPLPLTVAYAVIRHRVIDVRFVASRALVLGVIASIVAVIVIGIDWLFSTRLPASRFQAAVYVGLALVVGFSVNATWRSIAKTIDFVFFRPWYRAREQVEIVADATRHATSNLDLYEPLTAGIANAFSLASAALFERLEDGGFVRVAALGWLPGTTWHILPDDQLTVQVDKRQRIVDVDRFGWQKRNLPGGAARPTIMLPIVAGRHVAAMLLYGAHENGTALDPDELREIRRLCADAGLIYGRPRLESGRTALPAEPLGV